MPSHFIRTVLRRENNQKEHIKRMNSQSSLSLISSFCRDSSSFFVAQSVYSLIVVCLVFIVV